MCIPWKWAARDDTPRNSSQTPFIIMPLGLYILPGFQKGKITPKKFTQVLGYISFWKAPMWNMIYSFWRTMPVNHLINMQLTEEHRTMVWSFCVQTHVGCPLAEKFSTLNHHFSFPGGCFNLSVNEYFPQIICSSSLSYITGQ